MDFPTRNRFAHCVLGISEYPEPAFMMCIRSTATILAPFSGPRNQDPSPSLSLANPQYPAHHTRLFRSARRCQYVLACCTLLPLILVMSDYKPTEYEDQDSTEERPAPPTKRRKYTAVAWYAAHPDRGSGPFICHFFLYFSELASFWDQIID